MRRNPWTGRWLVAALIGTIGGGLVTGPTLATAQTADASVVNGASVYVAVTPTRVADTRNGFGTAPGGRLAAGGTTRVQIVGRPEVDVPTSATAVVVNLTVADTAAGGYVSVYPTGGGRPEVSNLNMPRRGFVGANLATVRLGADGAIEIFSDVATEVIVDVAGYYVPASGAPHAGRTMVTTPQRLFDSRSGGGRFTPKSVRTLTLDAVPDQAQAAILNVTVVDAAAGFWSVLPGSTRLAPGQEPNTSSVNVASAGSTVASQVVVPITQDRTVVVYASAGGHLIIDLFGYVTDERAAAANDGLFVALETPARVLDTRGPDSPTGAGHRLWPEWTVETVIAGREGIPTSGVSAVVGNLTSVDPHGPGWVAAYPAGTPYPGTSTLNTTAAGAVVANHTMTRISNRGVSLLASAGGHLLLDAAGYLTGPAGSATEASPVNVMPLPKFPLRIAIPAIGLSAPLEADSQPADLVHGPGWWPGTSYPGVRGNMAVFGHRTEETAPFRNLDRLRTGHRITVSGDHRTSVYEVRGWTVVPAADVHRYLTDNGGTVLTLIACAKPDGSATSLSHRIVVTAELVSYTDA